MQLRHLASLILKLILAAGLIAWLIHEGALDLKQVASVLSPLRVGIILICCFLLIFFNALRWRLLLRIRGLQLRMADVTPLALIAVFFNLAMPGGMGGDVVKGVYLAKDFPEHRELTVVSIIIDRLLGLFVLSLTASLAVMFQWSTVEGNNALETIGWTIFLTTLVFATFLFAALSPQMKNLNVFEPFKRFPWGKKLASGYGCVQSYRHYPKELGLAVLLSFVSQSFQILIFVLISYWHGVTVLGIADYLFLIPVGLVMTSVPISPAGVGVGQVAFYYLFNLAIGEPSPVGPATVTAFQLSQIAWGLVGAIFYIRRPDPKS